MEEPQTVWEEGHAFSAEGEACFKDFCTEAGHTWVKKRQTPNKEEGEGTVWSEKSEGQIM